VAQRFTAAINTLFSLLALAAEEATRRATQFFSELQNREVLQKVVKPLSRRFPC
jgi:hypothetical protein